MEPEEYESTKADTLKQLEEFHASLSRLIVRRLRAWRARVRCGVTLTFLVAPTPGG